MLQIFREARIAIRYLGRTKGTTLAAVLTIGLGIGACTAIFSVVQGVLLKPLPYPNPDKLVQVWQVSSRGGGYMQTSDPNFQEWRDQSTSFTDIAQFGTSVNSITGGVEPVRASVARVSKGFFDILGISPQIGRTFTEEEMQYGGPATVVVSHGFWQRFLNGDTNLNRRPLTFFNRTHEVVGVMPPGFSFPAGTDLWVSRETFPPNNSRTAHNWFVLGRIKPGVTLQSAQQEMHTIGRRQHQTYGEDIWLRDIDLVPLRDQLVGNVRTQLFLLLGAVGFLLLVACANVTNLMLARMSNRRKELAVRSALGAGRFDLGRQFPLESLSMTVAGGLLGLGLSTVGVRLLLQLEPGNLPRVGEIGMSWPVLVFALGLSLLTGLVLGLLPMFRMAGPGMFLLLKESGRGQTSGASSARLRGALVIGQVALTLVLLVGASLLGRSFLELLEVDPGFRTENLVTLQISQPYPRNDQEMTRLATSTGDILDGLERLPGVSEVGGVSNFPLTSRFPNGQFLVARSYEEWAFAAEGPDWERFEALAEISEKGYAEYRLASEDYFKTMDIPLIRGRWFEESDTRDAPHVCLISQSLAEEQWPNEDPIGKLIQFGNMDADLHLMRVVGIVGDVRDYGVEASVRPTVYAFYQQRPARSAYAFTIAMKSELPPESLIPAARQIIKDLEPDLPVQFATVEQVFSSSLADRRFAMLLLGIFGLAALSLAAIGIFAVMAYSVVQRTQEIGVRIALGADPGSVRSLVVRQGLLITGTGIVLGLIAALALTRIMASLLFGVSTLDPVAYAVAVPLLFVVAFLACYLPALRASRVDPLRALSSPGG